MDANEFTDQWLRELDINKIAFEGHPLLSSLRVDKNFRGNTLVSPTQLNDVNWHINRCHCYEDVVFAEETVSATRQARVLSCIKYFGDALSKSLYTTSDIINFAPLSGWVPYGAPWLDDNWFGVNRSYNHAALAGTAMNGVGCMPSEVFADADALAERNGSPEAPLYLNPRTYEGLRRSDRRSTMIMDSDCPDDVVWRLPDDHFEIVSLGEVPQVLNLDGNGIFRDKGALVVRVGFYANTVLHNPSHVVQIRGIELANRKSVQVPVNFTAHGDLSATKIATTVVQPTEIHCPNKTCGKPNDVGVHKCWNCEGAL